jgi:hypothetical protein
MTQNIHLIFKTHLDIGFTDYASVVVNNYFKKYIPASLRVARQMRESGRPERFIWTTGSWLIYEYLEQASPAERVEMENAIALGEIAWHALPFTTHTELMDPELFRFGLSLSQSLDRRFGKKTIAAKLTDVPGHTRGIVPLLVEAGVTFLHIGVNPGSTVPKVPRLFRWHDQTGAELMVMYESGYGSAFVINGLEDSLAFGHTSDNLGPQSEEEVLAVYHEKRKTFPGAHIFASTLNAFAEKLESVRKTLPVIDAEIGDTWIHGIGSDPIKVSRYRELLRLRTEWLNSKRADYNDPRFFNFNRRLLLIPEHTWGMDEKTYLGDHENYAADQFNAIRGTPNFKKFESSWIEKRTYIQTAVNALEDCSLANEARERLESIRPAQPKRAEFKKIDQVQSTFVTQTFEVMFNNVSGSICALKNNRTGKSWSDAENPLSLLSYQTFSAADYDRFHQQYILPSEQENGWSREDFTKPGLEIANPESKTWSVLTKGCYFQKKPDYSEILFHQSFETEAKTKYGAPRDIILRYRIPASGNTIHIDLQWFHKPACRMPEAMWIRFNPISTGRGEWKIEKLGRLISPLSVVEYGNRHLHAAGEYVEYSEVPDHIKIIPFDSPLVAPGEPSILNFTSEQPDPKRGVSFCLVNNLWGTNFPMWFEEDCRFRFDIVLG